MGALWLGLRSAGWAGGLTALLRAEPCTYVVTMDVSTVLEGDALTPLLELLDADPSVVGAGWRGVDVDLDDDWRSFVDAGPGEVDALLGYLAAFRRDALLAVGGPHPKAAFYRNADLELSLALREGAWLALLGCICMAAGAIWTRRAPTVHTASQGSDVWSEMSGWTPET